MLGDRGLYFGSGIDTRKFDEDIEKMRRKVLALQKDGEELDLQPLKAQIDLQIANLATYERQYKKLSQTISQTESPPIREALAKEHREIGLAIIEEKKQLDLLQNTYRTFEKDTTKVRTRQRELRHELYQLALAGKENSEQFQNAFKELKDLDSSVASVKALQSAINSGSVGMRAFVGAVRAGTGVFATFQGMVGMFADSNEKMAQIQTRLQSVMSLSIGIEQAYHATLKDGQLYMSVRALQARAFSKAQAMANKETLLATVYQKALIAVSKVNPYVLLAGAIISVVGALVLFSKRNKEVAESMTEVNKKMIEAVAEPITKFKLLQTQWTRLGSSFKQQEAFVKQNADQFRSLGLNIESVSDAERAFINQSDNIIRAFEARAKAAALQEVAQDAYKKYLQNREKAEEQAAKSTQDGIRGILARAWIGVKGLFKEQPIEIAGAAFQEYKRMVDEAAEALEEVDSLLGDLGKRDDVDVKIKVPKPEDIPVLDLEQQLAQRRKVWEDYYSAVAVIGKDKAKDIFALELEGFDDFVQELEAWGREIIKTEGITSKTVGQLDLLKRIIDELNGVDSPFEKMRKDLEKGLAEQDTFTNKLKFLEKEAEKLGNSFDDIRLRSIIKETSEKIVEERQKMYDDIIKAHQKYEDKIEEITKKYEDLRTIAKPGSDLEILDAEEAKEKYEAFIQMLKEKYTDLDKVFTDIASLTREQLIKFREVFEKELELTEDISRKNEIAKVIQQINKAIKQLDTNPIKDLGESIRKALSAPKGSTDKSNALKDVGEDIRKVGTESIKALDDISKAAENLGVEADSAFGKMLSGMKSLIEGAVDIGEGLAKTAFGIATSNPLAAVQGVAQGIKGITQIVGKWINQTEIQETQFERVRRVVDMLRVSYERLERTITALGSGVGSATQQRLIANLRQREAEILNYINSRTGGKARGGMDFKLTNEFKELQVELLEIQKQIRDIVEDITSDIFSMSAEDLSKRMGDALVDAFVRGEDAASALRETVDDMFRSMIRQTVSSAIGVRVKSILDEALREMGIDPATGLLITEGRNRPGLKTLSEEQIKALRERLVEAGMLEKALLDNLSDILKGIISMDQEELGDGLRGRIQGMSQETADVLAGQFNAIRIDVSSIFSLMKSNQDNMDAKVIYLSHIDTNTANIYKEIKDLNGKFTQEDVRSSGLIV